ncbi:growth arrest-specific protein 1-like [Ostrinia furnacalis]|uniref:growth arrest-specific protein 1-like n=1 Tax=Ostrinia furnacalis TaxID=93504 RepID=UPI0010404FCA|nr:growth arrest-specific protein 1-like [Ostrinia furnacalis]
MWLVAAVLLAAAADALRCQEAQMRCAYRAGCGAALQNYEMMCNDVLVETDAKCTEACEYALIALTSTVEGKDLMNCQCEDQYCEQARKRIDVCRPQVLKGAANVTSSCRLSQLVCMADAQCAAALGYYKQLCKSMFKGRKCSKKCRNSIKILMKQEKAAPLTTCQCDGYEDYDCPRMQNNLDRLCFSKSHHEPRNRKNHERGHVPKHHKYLENEVVPGAAPTIAISWSLFFSSAVLAFSIR